MAITTSAKKAYRQSLRKKVFNDKRKKALREGVKVMRVSKGDAAAASAAFQAIDKALKRGLIHKNTAARRKAAVSKLLKA